MRRIESVIGMVPVTLFPIAIFQGCYFSGGILRGFLKTPVLNVPRICRA